MRATTTSAIIAEAPTAGHECATTAITRPLTIVMKAPSTIDWVSANTDSTRSRRTSSERLSAPETAMAFRIYQIKFAPGEM